MIRKRVAIRSDEGLQAYSAALLVQTAGCFASGVWLERGNKRVNAKSIMGLLSLKLRKGDVFLLTVSGEDEQAAANAVAQLFEKGEV